MTDKQNSEQPETEDIMVCIGCTKTIPETADFYPHCGAPVGATACVDPYKRIFAGGYIARCFTSGTPRRWVFFAECVMGIALIPLNILTLFQAREIGGALAAVVVLSVSVAFYWRMARNYIRLHGRKTEEAGRTSA